MKTMPDPWNFDDSWAPGELWREVWEDDIYRELDEWDGTGLELAKVCGLLPVRSEDLATLPLFPELEVEFLLAQYSKFIDRGWGGDVRRSFELNNLRKKENVKLVQIEPHVCWSDPMIIEPGKTNDIKIAGYGFRSLKKPKVEIVWKNDRREISDSFSGGVDDYFATINLANYSDSLRTADRVEVTWADTEVAYYSIARGSNDPCKKRDSKEYCTECEWKDTKSQPGLLFPCREMRPGSNVAVSLVGNVTSGGRGAERPWIGAGIRTNKPTCVGNEAPCWGDLIGEGSVAFNLTNTSTVTAAGVATAFIAWTRCFPTSCAPADDLVIRVFVTN